MGVALYIITRVPENVQKVTQNKLNNFTHIKVTAVKNKNKFGKASETTEGFCFVVHITGLISPSE